MTLNLKIVAIAFLCIVILFVNFFVAKGKIAIKYSFVWSIPCFILILFILAPGLLMFTTNVLGFQAASNMIFALLFALLIFITISLTLIVSTQNNKIRLLIQEISILKGNRDEK